MTKRSSPRLEAADRARAVAPFHAMAMSAEASRLEREGRFICHLEVGQPSTGAPAGARRAVEEALRGSEPLGYTNAPGLFALEQRIARHYLDTQGVTVDPQRVMVVSGASAGFTLAFLACFDAGDRVGIIEPGYPAYRNALVALGIEPVAIPVGPDTRWSPTLAMLDSVSPLDGLIIASPSNPTGTMLDDAALAELTAWCANNDVQLIADEIYHGITYAGPAASALRHGDHVVVVNSFSKYFSMTGWRLGWVVVPDHLHDEMERLQQNLYICAPHISQIAGLAAFDCAEELDGHVIRYGRHRDLLIAGLRSGGITDFASADGAFYVYADVGHLTDDSLALCRRWLDELGVAATPGIDFDLQRGHRFVRFSYAGSQEHIERACELLTAWQP
ncbi:MAG: pyridoxal phosphate-dependent aminotransferase [Actinomycetota bacterium]